MAEQLIRGAFQFNAGALKAARAVVTSESRVITDEFRKISGAAEETESKVKRSSGGMSSSLRSVSSALDGISNQFKAASTAAAAFSAGGLMAAQSLKKTQVALEGLSGSAEEAARITQITRDLSNQFGLPFVDLLSGAKELVPVSRRTNVEMDRLLKTMVKLQGAVPDKAFNELRFSFSELLSGDYTSAADVLGILGGRSEFANVASFAKTGDIDGALNALDKMIEKSGITDEYLIKLRDSGVGAFDRLRSASQEALAAGFTPLLNDFVVPATEGFANFLTQLSQTNPEILKLAAGGAVLLASISPISFALSKIVAGYAAVKAAAIAAGVAIKANSTLLNPAAASWKDASFGTKLGVTGAALTTGVALGGQVVQGLANAGVQGGDFERVRKGENPLDIVGERIKQLVVILSAGLVELARVLTKGGAWILNAFDQILNVFRLGGTYITEAFINLQGTFGDLIYKIGELLSGIMDTTNIKNTGQALKDNATTRREENQQTRNDLQFRLKQGLTLPPEVEANIDAAFDQTGKTIVQGLNNFLFPVQEAADKTAQGLEDAGQSIMDASQAGGSRFTDEMVSAFSEFQDELTAIQDNAQAERKKEVAEYETGLTSLIKEQGDTRLAAESEFARKRAEDALKLSQSIEDINRDFDRKEKEERRRARREEVKRVLEHGMSLLKAAASLDGRAVYLEQQRFKNETQTRKTELVQGKKDREREREQRIADLNLQFQREQAVDMQNFYGVKLPQMEQQQAAELAKFADAHTKRLAQIDAQAESESAKAEAAFIKTFDKLVQSENAHQGLMLQTQRTGQAAMEAELALWWSRQRAMLSTGGTAAGVTNPAYNLSTPGPVQVPTPSFSVPLPQAPGGERQMVQYASGTLSSIRGGWSKLDPEEIVLRKDAARLARMAANGSGLQSRVAESFGGMLGGKSGRNTGNATYNVDAKIVLGDIGKRSNAEVEALIERGIEKVLEKLS